MLGAPTPAPAGGGLGLALAYRTLALGALWLVLTEGSLSSPVLAAAIVGAAVWLSLGLVPPLGRWRLLEVGRFTALFLWESALGGIDVARRALHLRPPLEPRLVERPLHLERESAAIFFCACVSLLPGTVAADLQEGTLVVHVIDARMSTEETLDRVERAVGRLFGESPVGRRHPA